MSRILMLVLAFMLLPVLAADPSSGGVPKGNPRLASLQIEIWPEYDRPAALVILKGELTADVALPAAVFLRIAAASGGPAAVASSTGPSAKLFNAKYERKDAGDFITLRFEVTERFFHVEFYEPLATRTPDRDYTYVWPGDLAVDRLSVIVQEPAAASDLSVQPNLDAAAAGQDGLRYRSAELGAFAAGKQLPIKVRYTKTDSRVSSEILQLKAPGSSPVPATGSGKLPFGWILVLGVAPVLLIGAGAALLWWRRRRKVSGARPSGTGFCSKCGQPASGDPFCSKCGAPVRVHPR
ncbi:MAG: zinc ribbon domain-containing protein [Sulfuricaulis sp.]|nr:zinc ribbon domain-containing protein [Sulfuricaulis sp.]